MKLELGLFSITRGKTLQYNLRERGKGVRLAGERCTEKRRSEQANCFSLSSVRGFPRDEKTKTTDRTTVLLLCRA